MLAVELHLTTVNAKAEPDELLVAEFSRAFADEPHEAIQWAFRHWRDVSRFMPAISDIKGLIAIWHSDRWHETERLRAAIEKKELETARARGELVDFGDLKKKLAEVAAKKGMP